MADGSTKPIEEVEVGDMVLAFDPDTDGGLGRSVPKPVTRTFTNVTRVLIDVHGVLMTPGHLCLADKGEWMVVADILRDDRCMVREVNGKGVVFRARTGVAKGSFHDLPMLAHFTDSKTGARRTAVVRAGIPFAVKQIPDAPLIMGKTVPLADVMLASDQLDREASLKAGIFIAADGRPMEQQSWPEGYDPFSFDPRGNWVVALDGQPFVPDWIARIPHDGEETRAVMNAGGGPNDLLLITPYGARVQKQGGGAFSQPVAKHGLPPQRPTMVPGGWSDAPLPPVNRAQRRKQAALQRVK